MRLYLFDFQTGPLQVDEKFRPPFCFSVLDGASFLGAVRLVGRDLLLARHVGDVLLINQHEICGKKKNKESSEGKFYSYPYENESKK